MNLKTYFRYLYHPRKIVIKLSSKKLLPFITDEMHINLMFKEKFGESFVYRDKMGFGYILMDYFMQPKTQEYIEKTILPNIEKRKLFDYKEVLAIWNQEKILYKKKISF